METSITDFPAVSNTHRAQAAGILSPVESFGAASSRHGFLQHGNFNIYATA